MKKNDAATADSSSYAGDKFWLDFAAKAITDTNPAMTRQAERLSTTVAWLWTAYLAFLALSLQAGSTINVIASVPCASLVISYILATIAAGPGFGKFDPRSPDDVRRAFNSSVRRRRVTLLASQSIVVLSSVLIFVGIMT